VSTLPADPNRPREAPAQILGTSPAALTGWGGGPPTSVWRWRPADPDALRAGLASRATPAAGVIARGLGRSYGDAALRRDGLVVETRHLRQLALDAQTGVVTAGAGVTIGELLSATTRTGWIVPVVPGTQHVTVGGAIASDIHGKNHGSAGTFARHVRALGLLTARGEIRELQAGDRAFNATVGGMGLTGVVVWARIALRRVASPMLSVDTDRTVSLDGALELLSSPGGEHRVAWLDLLSRPEPRGVVTRAHHVDTGTVPLTGEEATRKVRLTVPRGWPAGLLSRKTVRAFNEVRFYRSPHHERGRLEAFGIHMFPLDGVNAWPRLYGPQGLLQYQFAVPRGAEPAIRQVLKQLARADVPCFLAVLKDFGPAGAGLLSFPMVGWTLALDIPRAAPGLDPALERCDEVVAEAGGRVYLTKDARLRASTARAMYPRLAEWRTIRDELDPERVWCSDLGLRTGLVGGRGQ
jgi:decaprenylphospho-beta-D-ribofuranose 2-oxidase